MGSLGIVSQEWLSRPAEERFESLDAVQTVLNARTAISHEKVVGSRNADFSVIEGEPYIDFGDGPMRLNHYTFDQVASLSTLGSGFARKLWKARGHSQLEDEVVEFIIPAALKLGYARLRDKSEVKLLYSGVPGEQGCTLRAVNGVDYGRVYDSQMVNALVERLDPNTWVPPGTFGQAADGGKATTIYAGDRSTLVFLCRTQPFEVLGRQHFQGIIGFSSETGHRNLGAMLFDYDFMCSNRNIWGVTNLQTTKIRHTRSAPERFQAEFLPALDRYTRVDPGALVASYEAAAKRKIGKTLEQVKNFIKAKGFTEVLAEKAVRAAVDDDINPKTLYGVVHGLTRAVQSESFEDDRFGMEMQIGKLMPKPEFSLIGR